MRNASQGDEQYVLECVCFKADSCVILVIVVISMRHYRLEERAYRVSLTCVMQHP